MKEHNTTKQEEAIIQEIKRYSKRFIEQMGGFYPFAIGLNNKNEIFSIGAYDGSEFPMSFELIRLLETSIKTEILNQNIALAAICIDVFVNQIIEGFKIKKSAIEIRFMNESERKTKHLFYEKSRNNSVEFFGLENAPNC